MRIIIILQLRFLSGFSAAYIIRAASGTETTMLMKSGNMTLAALRKGQKGVIEAVDAGSPLVQRLMTLGLVEGAEVELAGSALGGDPLEVRLFGRGISLRREQAQHFYVSPAGARD